MMRNAQQLAQDLDGRCEKITDPVRMAGVFRNLATNRALLSVTPADSNQAFNTALVQMDPQRGLLWIDEIGPPRAHERILEKRRFRVEASLNGVNVRFNVELRSAGRPEDDACYVVPFPLTLDYYQRRAHYRAKVRQARSVPVLFRMARAQPISGRLRDISIGGLKATFSDPLVTLVGPGTRVQDCEIALPSDAHIESELEIRFISRRSQQGSQIVGARFLNLDRRLEQSIARFVAELDRENLKVAGAMD